MEASLYIVKIGGNVIDSPEQLQRFLRSFASLPGKKILVHGGGKLATELAEQLGIPQQMIDGRRITDAATLKVVTMVYAGYINKQIVAQLQATGCAAVGLSGADGNLLQAHKRHSAVRDYGYAGDVDEVNAGFAGSLLEQGYTLVVAPLSHDRQGQLLNTNADTIAQELAQALAPYYEVQLLYCFEKAGVLRTLSDEQSLIPLLTAADFPLLQAQGVVHAGMLPKLQNAFAALEKGVRKVVIGKWDRLEAMTLQQSGTTIIL